MSGHPQGGHYDDGYGQTQPADQHAQHAQQGQDGYYHDDQSYGQYHDDAHGNGQYQQHGDAYYDES
jgi:1,3-beta-glucan synthase